MKVLVVIASQHGATAEIGDAIVEELRTAGHESRRVEPADVRDLEGIDAVVLGSAVYMTQWMESARNFVQRFRTELREIPLWTFSCGLAGVPKGNVQDPRRVGPVLLSINPIDHEVFKGRLDLGALSLRERTVARLGNAPEGDYREWDKIKEWASEIASQLTEQEELQQ
ncbi:flavodoxin [Bowdeniella nasicola]|uniref:Flavodoxin n=1 Tax=Bowdeniella nasicola TaxID=208480 RepID=A0A1Q5Q153_9ACTO|nr:flavodoxin domain-containing protein [Bowdeniella nasicola]OKL53496.1 flavodoxin [Bowdeniella nasicola]